MPTSAPKICSKPGCYVIVSKGTRCDKHVIKSWAHSKSRQERGYGASWERKRKRIFKRDNYLCQDECKRNGRHTPATEIDHIIPKSRGGTDEDVNLQSICNDCHKIKTARESN